MMTNRVIWGNHGTNTKRSQIVFAVTSIALTLASLGAKRLELALQSLIGSPGTLTLGHFRGLRGQVVEQWCCPYFYDLSPEM